MTDENAQSTPPQAITPEQLGRILEKGAEARREMLLNRIDASYANEKLPYSEQIIISNTLKMRASYFAKFIATELPAGNYMEIALNKLEEATMWASKAISCDYKPKTDA